MCSCCPRSPSAGKVGSGAYGTLPRALCPQGLDTLPKGPSSLQGIHSIVMPLLFPLHQVKKHLWNYLKKQMRPFLEGKSGDALPEGCPVKSRLRMGLIILFLVKDTKLCLFEHDLTSLCSILCPSPCSPDALHSDLHHILFTSERYPMFFLFCFVRGFVGIYHDFYLNRDKC